NVRHGIERSARHRPYSPQRQDDGPGEDQKTIARTPVDCVCDHYFVPGPTAARLPCDDRQLLAAELLSTSTHANRRFPSSSTHDLTCAPVNAASRRRQTHNISHRR